MPTAGTFEAPIRVAICDDHAVFRRGLVLVLEEEPDIEVVAEAADGDAALAVVTQLMPDVLLLDVRMPGTNGIDTARAIRASSPAVKLIMLTVSEDEADLFEAVKAGANGYLLKEISIEDVAESVRAVVAGRSLIPPTMASKLLDEFADLADRAARTEAGGPASPPRLTDRETEVLTLVARGRGNREIGAELGISENTAKNHVRNILEKLHLHSRTEAAMYAVRTRLIDPDG